MLTAATVSGLLFAGLHELGEFMAGDNTLIAQIFLTRFLFPGFFMSWLFFRLHPAFIITAHLTAHLLIPFYFI